MSSYKLNDGSRVIVRGTWVIFKAKDKYINFQGYTITLALLNALNERI